MNDERQRVIRHFPPFIIHHSYFIIKNLGYGRCAG
jgi:hypothetical protein